jgi:hypothetical protein
MKQNVATARRAPSTRPGKKPATTAPAGKEGQAQAGESGEDMGRGSVVVKGIEVLDAGSVEVRKVVDGLVVERGVLEDEDSEDGEGESKCWFASMLQNVPSELQLYPNGQHCEPHFGSDLSRLVVLMFDSGCMLTFCRLTSQVIGAMTSQVFPDGQQRIVVFAESRLQVLPEGQQKSFGRGATVHATKPLKLQVWVRAKRVPALAVLARRSRE